MTAYWTASLFSDQKVIHRPGCKCRPLWGVQMLLSESRMNADDACEFHAQKMASWGLIEAMCWKERPSTWQTFSTHPDGALLSCCERRLYGCYNDEWYSWIC